MPALTRRRSPDNPDTWHVYREDVRIGTIGRCSGVPSSSDQWFWSVGFYPGLDVGLHRSSSAPTFEDARAGFERAWHQIAQGLAEAHFETWRRDRDLHAWKRRMWAEGCRMPTQNIDGRSTCFCGEPITIACEAHIHTAHRGIGA
ncbi:hypothetical protein [Bradyrhizobium cosmicum]|uniref:hypothetical protein n=1 Tax=Bradyrhizobium cosmicum TaxID=1404864 RepID=UPI001164EA1F|nr:hypothetical protein [Bradyrhizobium cosmicum]QDP20650.1 hypothetical protein FNV92_00115 [Bradyrhizobium cosmicum]QDP27000.1 hypothetical protein FNV92_34810 [Bradyrhizobium cosmicum]